MIGTKIIQFLVWLQLFTIITKVLEVDTSFTIMGSLKLYINYFYSIINVYFSNIYIFKNRINGLTKK